MPNEEDKTVVDATAAPSAEQPAAAPAGKKKLMLFGGIGLGAIVIGVALALLVVKPMLAPSAETPSSAEVKPPKDSHKPSHDDHGAKDSHGNAQGGSRIYTIDDIVINPAGTGGSRFLSASIGFELESEAVVMEFRAREPMIRDALITILSSKTVAQLTDARQKEITRYQIKKRVAELMKTEQLAGVYYTDFVLQ